MDVKRTKDNIVVCVCEVGPWGGLVVSVRVCGWLSKKAYVCVPV